MDDGDKEERELGLRFALILLGKCDELWVFGNTFQAVCQKKLLGQKSEVCLLDTSIANARR
jgi:hypothetical protein